MYLLVPYKALANEKGQQFTAEFQAFGFAVLTITSDSEDLPKTLPDADCIIATYEKCDSLLRQNLTLMKSVKCIVIDEVHEISTPMRGGRLEILITRILSQLPFVTTDHSVSHDKQLCCLSRVVKFLRNAISTCAN